MTVEALRRQPLSFGNLLLPFFFDLFLLLAKNLAFSAVSGLFFLVHCFFRAICQSLCWRVCGVVNKTLNLECFGSRFSWFFFVYRLFHNILADIIFLRKSEKFVGSAGSFGPHVMRHAVVPVSSGISFSPFFFYNNQVENSEIGIHNTTPNRYVLSFSSCLGL